MLGLPLNKTPAEERSYFYDLFYQVKNVDKPAWITARSNELIRIAQLNGLTPFNMFYPLYFQCKVIDRSFDIAKSGMPFVASLQDISRFVDLLRPERLFVFLQTCLPVCDFLKTQFGVNAESADAAFDFLKSLYEKFNDSDQVFEHTTLFFNWVKSPDDLDKLKATMLLDYAVRLKIDDDAFLMEKEKALNDAFFVYQENKKDSESPVMLVRSKQLVSTSNNALFSKKSKKQEKGSPNRERKHHHQNTN